MKKWSKQILGIILLVFMCMPILAETNDAQLDAVLVIDASGSMKETDPNKLGLEGVKLFVDMLGLTDNQVGVVTYGSEVSSVYPMSIVSTQGDKEDIKAFVDSIDRDLEYTDITSGLTQAIDMLDSRKNTGNSPLIIIFTDGNNAVGGVPNRDYQKIDADLKVLLERAHQNSYPIYTIGLNDNGKLNEAYLENISTQTEAMAFATKDPKELPDILTKIFAAHSNLKVQSLNTMVGTGQFEEVNVNIPNANVLEANLSAMSNQGVTFRLEDPNGVEQTIPSQNITLHTSNSYSLLKISKPMKGDWKLYVKGIPGDQINIDLVYNYDIGVSIGPLTNTQFSKGDDFEVEAYLSLQGAAINDPSLYASAKASLVLTDINTGVETRVAMTSSTDSFIGYYQLKDEGDFKVKVIVEDTSYIRESEEIDINVGTKANQSTTKPSISQENKEGNEEEGRPNWILISLGSILVVVLIVGGVIILKKVKQAKTPLVGQVVIELKDNTTGKLTPPQYKKLNVFTGKVSLHALLQFAPEFKEAGNIMLKGAPGDKVFLYNASAYQIEKSGRIVKASEGLELKRGDKLSINMADSGQTIQIEYLL